MAVELQTFKSGNNPFVTFGKAEDGINWRLESGHPLYGSIDTKGLEHNILIDGGGMTIAWFRSSGNNAWRILNLAMGTEASKFSFAAWGAGDPTLEPPIRSLVYKKEGQRFCIVEFSRGIGPTSVTVNNDALTWQHPDTQRKGVTVKYERSPNGNLTIASVNFNPVDTLQNQELGSNLRALNLPVSIDKDDAVAMAHMFANICNTTLVLPHS